ncbi:NAD(P)-dependent dehydrogenase (short-subunit alcohol dehydrogenase family) [Amaricoccus macauensis]|uniref:NAD(P)-dependent dehydrogenase (Short-subunit alcohol dehydrogenase family) n=1 Tax=Amaricoccus macauensis TaxID=57001 RepID=A0A840SRL9_9RHOB|nr:SDR family NAD(P)-dependent oxidoreductase [Amaricoccus macauensis]MBB5223178.1 NAD(P)-dependent dehydrogenase (short-subunit alcohol dehydrogenase family) [Amaricoccus macauensis]
MQRLQGKVAIITGGAGGIGEATAARFVSEGTKVLLVDIDAGALSQVAGRLDAGSVATCVADVSSAEDVQRYVAEAIDRFGRLHTIFSNVGTEGAIAPITDYPLEAFDKVMAANVRGVRRQGDRRRAGIVATKNSARTVAKSTLHI